MEKKNVKKLAELIYDPEEDFLLSKQAAVGIAERFYKELGNNAEKFTSFYRSNKEKAEKIFEDYLSFNSLSSVFNSLTDEKAMQSLIYKNLLKMEKDLRENSYDVKKIEKIIKTRTGGNYDF
ncbi:MAG: hypothetical protein QXD02_04400 [Candidatus Parvarchaeum sp.]|nr:hypothetical protein [Candidatus Parvarchaeota archaeon]MCW1294465.1 hypothetical protein [Candidatus Parvarchaeum tengchongense]MCW1295404.1 hypothetical protein [Candidatus Parvarchaeum tengchongense]MCW1299532.1 hypothetical protein [Candidatus Parvarchaeum tengchongense]